MKALKKRKVFVNKYKCIYCNKDYKYKGCYNNHFRKFHPRALKTVNLFSLIEGV